MTFRGKALAFSLSIGVLASLLAVVITVSIQMVVRDSNQLDRVAKIGRDVRDAETLASEILLGGGGRAFQQWNQLADTLRMNLDDLQSFPFVTVGLIDEFASRIDSMDRTFKRLSETPAGAAPVVREILASRIQADKGALVSRVGSIEAEVRRIQSATFRMVAIANLAVVACLILLAVAHHLIMRRFLSGAWADLTSAIQQIEAGDVATPILTTRRDELGRMLLALDEMRQSLHTTISAEDAARRAAEDLSSIKSRFVASVSHELRTPLMGLLGLIELANRRQTLAEIRRDLISAQGAGQHLLELINQILDFSKLEADKLELISAPFNLDATLKTVESIFAVQAVEKGLELKLVPPRTSSPSVLGDQQRLLQVLFNLVSNAVKFTEFGSVTITYDVTRIGDSSAELRVDVIDSGPGIPEDAREQIFTDFFQISSQNAKGQVGTGLGLAISARLIELMGGKIGLVSHTESGAHFYVSLILRRAAETDAPVTAPEAVRPSRPLNVLLAEDVDTNRMIVREILVGEGHRVVEAENGQLCLDRLHGDERFDAVLMDINMPVLDGISATRAIRSATAPWRDIPIVGLTANAFEQQVKGYLSAGMTACISKPVKWDDLLSILASVTTGTTHSQSLGDDDTGGETPLLDTVRLSEMLSLLGGNTLAHLFTRSEAVLRENATILEEAARDVDALKLALHRLRGAAANLGCLRLAERAEQAERNCETVGGESSEIEQIPTLVEETLEATHRWLERHLAA